MVVIIGQTQGTKRRRSICQQRGIEMLTALQRLFAVCLFLGTGSAAWAQTNSNQAEIRVMSYNIRYGTANDGANHWNRRKELLVSTIKAFDPDLLGTQETLKFQRDYLAMQLAEYDVLGAGRDDGKESGEMTALYFKRSRFERLDSGHFWLSETPGVVGSKGWDAAIVRMVSWVKLRDRQAPEARPLIFFNTHFDHRGMRARLESAWLLRRCIEALGQNDRIIVTGDFNADEDSAPYHILFDGLGSKPPPVLDAYRVTHPMRVENEGTFSGFRLKVTNGPRMDWIGVSAGWTVISAEIDRSARNGSTPSDHFAMKAVLR
jgi:endonuclease/exonuclease/phosphatase family metal-dependent hydrolase